MAKQDNLKQNKRSHNIKIFKKKLQKICHFTNFYSSCCQTLPTGHKKKTLIKCTSNSLLCLYKMRSQQFCNSEASEGVDIKEFFQLLVTYYFPLVRRILHKAIRNLTCVLAITWTTHNKAILSSEPQLKSSSNPKGSRPLAW